MKDPGYLIWVRRQPCWQCGKAPAGCAHHKTGAGMGLRASDLDAMPLCHGCHMAFHDGKGPFKGWGKARRRQWQEEAIAATRLAHTEEVF